MNKNVGLTYVKEFSFPAEQGFTGSASSGVHQVKGYQRGGVVKKLQDSMTDSMTKKLSKLKGTKDPMVAKLSKLKGTKSDADRKAMERLSASKKGMPSNVKSHGGVVKKQMGGYMGNLGGMGQEREITVDDVKISVPKNRGGKMSMHDKLYHEGGKMGYAYGGQVKPSNTSAEFKQTRGKQDTMDTGNQPARRGRNQAEIEAGGTKRLKPGLSHGGHIKGVASSGGGALADAALIRVRQVLKPSKKMSPPKKASRTDPMVAKLRKLKGFKSDADMRAASAKNMPANVKARGGHVYATGGVVKKAGAAL